MSLCLVCPGQGSQSPDMLDRLGRDPSTSDILVTLSAHVEPGTMAVAADPAHCFLNRHAQPLIALHGLTVAQALSRAGIDAALVAGYSVGELTAYGVAGALDAEHVLALAAERARAMDTASPPDHGMLAVRGLNREVVRACAGSVGVAIAIVNGADHVVLAGPNPALQAVATRLGASHAPHVVSLPISVPAHSKWLRGGVAAFAAALAAVPWRAAQAPVLSGIDGRPVTRAADAIERLSRQIAEPLDWARTMDVAVEMGATVFFELGPGCGLTRMLRERFPALPARALAEFDTVRGAVTWLGRQLH